MSRLSAEWARDLAVLFWIVAAYWSAYHHGFAQGRAEVLQERAADARKSPAEAPSSAPSLGEAGCMGCAGVKS